MCYFLLELDQFVYFQFKSGICIPGAQKEKVPNVLQFIFFLKQQQPK